MMTHRFKTLNIKNIYIDLKSYTWVQLSANVYFCKMLKVLTPFSKLSAEPSSKVSCDKSGESSGLTDNKISRFR